MTIWTQYVGSLLFALAVIHTFLVKFFQRIALTYPDGSPQENLFHLLGEVEVVFGFWAGVFVLFLAIHLGAHYPSEYLNGLNFTEPVFVFVIMTVCSTKPILEVSEWAISAMSKLIPLKGPSAFYIATLVLGPILGSFITEPAAMTVTALILLRRYFSKGISPRLMYATIGLLFVNISIGGTLTPYAAPPVLMVAAKWNWDLLFMMKNFGWKAVIAILVSTLGTYWFFRKELNQLRTQRTESVKGAPEWVIALHLLFLILIVVTHKDMSVFLGLFLFFLGLVKVTSEYQSELKLREGLLVGFFLGGLVVLGAPQKWWLQPLITSLDSFTLFSGATLLTAITDNAALTFLGSQVEGLSDVSKYALVAGAVTGGGLTVIANAPNPAGYGILNSSFGKQGIDPLRLFVFALPSTIVAALCFWFF